MMALGTWLPFGAMAHATHDSHVHDGDLGSLLLLAAIAGIAVWLDRRTR